MTKSKTTTLPPSAAESATGHNPSPTAKSATKHAPTDAEFQRTEGPHPAVTHSVAGGVPVAGGVHADAAKHAPAGASIPAPAHGVPSHESLGTPVPVVIVPMPGEVHPRETIKGVEPPKPEELPVPEANAGVYDRLEGVADDLRKSQHSDYDVGRANALGLVEQALKALKLPNGAPQPKDTTVVL